jgi:ATP-dependent Clp protease ATP-binding subunit ClpC
VFERYTEKARRTIFFARYEASEFGSPFIEPHHLLLAILREQPEVLPDSLRSADRCGELRSRFTRDFPPVQRLSTSVDIPLSPESKRVLAYAAEESERLRHRHIGTEHLYLGLMREDGTAAARALRDYGVPITEARTGLGRAGNAREALLALIDLLPQERWSAAERLLRALASEHVALRAVTEAEQFTISFGQPREGAGDV